MCVYWGRYSIATKSSAESHEMVLVLHPKINGVKIIAFISDLWRKYEQVFTLGHVCRRGRGMCLIYYMWKSNFGGRPIRHNFYCIAKASSIMR